MHLTVTAQRQGVAADPVGTTTRTDGLVETVTLANTSVLLANGGKTTGFAVLVDRVADPVHARISGNSLVARINKDDFVVLVGGVLVNPVGVQDTQVRATTTNTLFSSSAEGTLVLELVNTLGSRLAINLTLSNRSLSATTTNTDSVDDMTLLGLVSETTSLVRTGRTGSTVDDIELSVFPASQSEKEAHHIRLLLLVQFGNVLVAGHLFK